MNTRMRYLINLLRIICWKIRFRGRLTIHPLQLLSGSPSLRISAAGSAVLRGGLSNRGTLSVIVEAGTLTIGAGTFFNSNCSITCLEKIEIGDYCAIANNVVIVDHDHNYKGIGEKKFLSAPIRIGSNVWIGANCVILKGSVIGDNSVIAAGSVVNCEVESNTLFYQTRTMNTKSIQRNG